MGPGNGESIAKRFGREGYKIYMISRNEEKLQKFKDDLEAQKIKADYQVADASNEEHLRVAFKKILLEHPNPAILVYNASVLHPKVPSRLVPDHVIRDFKANVVGAIISAQEVIPSMLKKKSGTILITGGGLAINPYYEFSSLGIGKSALRNFTHSLAQELKGTGVHVATLIINGMIKKGTKFDPDKIADRFWEIQNRKEKDWKVEEIFE